MTPGANPQWVDGGPPMQEGLHFDARVEQPDEKLIGKLQKLAAAATLCEVTDEFAAFTHGPFFTHLNMKFDPIAEYFRDRARWEQPIVIRTDKPLFFGMTAEWNCRLCLISLDVSEPFFRWLSGVTLLNRDTKFLAQADLWDVPVPDVAALSRLTLQPAVPPLFPCRCLGLKTNRCDIRFIPNKANPTDPVRVTRILPADPAFVRFTEQVMAEGVNPLAGTIEPTLEQAINLAVDARSRQRPDQ